MKRFLALSILASLCFSFLPAAAAKGQDEARAIWQVSSFNIAASVLQTERALGAVAMLTIRNVGRGAKARRNFSDDTLI